MRHMETFKGDTKKWDSGLAEEGVSELDNYLLYCNIHEHLPKLLTLFQNIMQIIQDHQLRRFRIKYNTAILSSGLNAFHKGIVDEGAKLAEQAATYRDFKVAAFEKNPTVPNSILKDKFCKEESCFCN